MMLILIIGIGALFYVLYFKDKKTEDFHISGKKTPEDILKTRFVNGEINEETYIKMKDLLQK
ncbi:MAG: SHOCT domain-containing protein [Lachnospiraceae bacterium]